MSDPASCKFCIATTLEVWHVKSNTDRGTILDLNAKHPFLQLLLVPKVDTFRYYCCMSCCRRESWSIFSTYTCWQHLLGITRQQSRDHSVLSDVYTNSMNQRLSDVCEDSRRLYTKVHIHLKHHLIL